MNSKNNRNNHDFQIAYFIAGSCHTADGAYALLCAQRDDREIALGTARAEALRTEAKRLRYERMAADPDEVVALEGRAGLAELEAFASVTAKNVAGAEAELETINKCIAKLQPLRKYAHLPDPDAFEAAQRDEWCEELVYRAENFMITQGSIPHDHFATMRQHPDFRERILPVIERLHTSLVQGTALSALRDESKPTLIAKELTCILTENPSTPHLQSASET